MPRKTGFDRYVGEQLKRPGFRAGYEEAQREIDAVGQVVRALDFARISLGVSKAALARQIAAKPEILRRLFTRSGSNPTLATVAKLAAALGQRLILVPEQVVTKQQGRRDPKKSKTKQAA